MNEYTRLLNRCTRFLSHHDPKKFQPAKVLAELAEAAGDQDADNYGEGEMITSFEDEVARLLGKESAVFMPSGTMAQQIALRIWTNRKGTKNVAFHPKCHLEIHERKGYQVLHGINGILVGSEYRLMTLDDLKKVPEPLGALLLELPQREIGGQLPSWEELLEMTRWARERGIPLHMDGARLWECGPFYGRSYNDISALFDTVYVSFYKGFAGISGAVLAGPADFIAESRIWLRRHGGNLKSLYPLVLSAKLGMDRYLPRMAVYHEKAVEVASVLASFPQIEVVPNPPPTNMMHVYLRGDKARLEQAARELAEDQGVFLFYNLSPSPIPAYSMWEVTIKEGAQELSAEEIRCLFEILFQKAGS